VWSRIRPRCAISLGKSIVVAFSNSRSPRGYEFAMYRNVGSPLVVSAALLEAAMGSEDPTTWRRLPPQELKGHRQPVEAYCLAT
jgi:class 3 adenylate cyclase